MNLVLGANGFIGRHLYRLLASRSSVLGTYYPHSAAAAKENLLLLDVCKPTAALWRKLPPLQRVFICIQHGSLDDCRRQRAATAAVNVRGVMRALRHIQRLGGVPIFLSSNFVFAGSHKKYSERSHPSPRTEYGRQKYAVEQYIRRRFPCYCIARLTKVFSFVEPRGYIFHDWLRDMHSGRPISAAMGVEISPLWVRDAVHSLALLDPFQKPGIYHFAGPDSGSPAHYAKRLARHFNLDTALVRPRTMESFHWLEKRPRYNLLGDRATRRRLRLHPATIEAASDYELTEPPAPHAMLAV